MALRIHFTPDDLCRVRVASGPHPLWELILSINGLQSPRLPARYWQWRTSVSAARRQAPEQWRWLAAAAELVPVSGNFPDFLTPPLNDTDAEAHYEAMLSLPRNAVREDLTRTFRRYPAPPWARDLYHHGRVEGLVGVLRRYHEFAMRPVWPQVHQHVETDRARYARCLLDRGVEGLLHSLHPSIRWRNPVLEADYPVACSIDLAGRGLLVVPAHFCWGAPVTFIDADQPPMLVCPASGDTLATVPDPGFSDAREDRLARLLGHTRARLLAEVAVAASTTELANRLTVSPAAVSQHTRVLREAGLLTTCRFGPSVQHSLTPLGRELMDG